MSVNSCSRIHFNSILIIYFGECFTTTCSCFWNLRSHSQLRNGCERRDRDCRENCTKNQNGLNMTRQAKKDRRNDILFKTTSHLKKKKLLVTWNLTPILRRSTPKIDCSLATSPRGCKRHSITHLSILFKTSSVAWWWSVLPETGMHLSRPRNHKVMNKTFDFQLNCIESWTQILIGGLPPWLQEN